VTPGLPSPGPSVARTPPDQATQAPIGGGRRSCQDRQEPCVFSPANKLKPWSRVVPIALGFFIVTAMPRFHNARSFCIALNHYPRLYRGAALWLLCLTTGSSKRVASRRAEMASICSFFTLFFRRLPSGTPPPPSSIVAAPRPAGNARPGSVQNGCAAGSGSPHPLRE